MKQKWRNGEAITTVERLKIYGCFQQRGVWFYPAQVLHKPGKQDEVFRLACPFYRQNIEQEHGRCFPANDVK